MKAIIEKPLELLEGLFYLAFPMFDHEAASRFGDPAVRWMGRVLVVGLALAALAAINGSRAFGLSNVIHSTVPWAARYWLPLLASCLYAMLWLGWWLFRLLTLNVEPAAPEFPDIDRAWRQAMEALGRAEIALDATPLFLVLGWPSATEEDYFRAANIKGPVRQAPGEPDAPLHVTANRDGIWVTCPGVSLLAQYAPGGPATKEQEGPAASSSDELIDPFKTVAPAPGWSSTLQAGDYQSPLQAALWAARTARSKLVEDPERHLARLRRLCQLIIGDRRGLCPINGVLLTLPLDVEARPESAEIADACRKDLAALFDTFHMRCPVLAMVGGLEEVEGFAELIALLPPEQVRKRMGQRFPLVPDLTADELPMKVQEVVEVVSGRMFSAMVHALFQVESKGVEDAEDVLHANWKLFRFLEIIIGKGERIARLIKDCLPTLRGDPIMFGGCYFAGTGRDSASEQAFASGVLVRMIKDEQDNVTWTREALEKDAASRRLAERVRIAFLTVLALGVLIAAGMIARDLFSGRPAHAPSAAVAPKN